MASEHVFTANHAKLLVGETGNFRVLVWVRIRVMTGRVWQSAAHSRR